MMRYTLKQLFWSQLPIMGPFFFWTVMYFGFVQDLHSTRWTTILKCLPIMSLMFYIFFNGVHLEEYSYNRRIFLGLFFSCFGDMLLHIDYFTCGMCFFAFAQIFYIEAMGYKPLRLDLAVPLYLAGAAFIGIVFKNLHSTLVVGLPVYVFLLLTMCWRTLAKATEHLNFLCVFCAVGSVFFVISDALIGVDMFLTEVPNAMVWIMSTYYFAQFAITFSTADLVMKTLARERLKKRNITARRLKINKD